jgi:hypothetical protein
MPINKDHWDHRGQNNWGVVIYCPNLIGDRFVYLDHNRTTGNWVLRDFIKGERLNRDDSQMTMNDFLKGAATGGHSEAPPWLNAERDIKEWKTYLSDRTQAALKLHDDPISEDRPIQATNGWELLV